MNLYNIAYKFLLFICIGISLEAGYIFLRDHYIFPYLKKESPSMAIDTDYLQLALYAISLYFYKGSFFILIWEIYDRKNKIKNNTVDVIDT